MENNSFLLFINSILSLPYFGNDTAGNFADHEKQIKYKLEQHGFISLPPQKNKKNELNRMMEKMEPNTFVYQPFGSQNSPDFIVKTDTGVCFCIECKSCITSCSPVYNSGSIHNDYIYIFTNKKTNSTTLFLGSDIISQEQLDCIEETDKLIRELLKERNKKLQELDLHKRGWYYYSRRMISQGGNKTTTNYFEHPEREKCEKNVIEFVQQKLLGING